MDIFPTLSELAGLPASSGPQPIDGVSLVPVLKNPNARVRDHAYHASPRGGKLGRAIRTQRYRWVEWKKHSDPQARVDYELYDYKTDPWETQNQYVDRPNIAKRLKTILSKHPSPKTRSRR